MDGHGRLLWPWDSPGKNTGVGCHGLLQGIFQFRDQTHVTYVSCIDRGSLPLANLGSPFLPIMCGFNYQPSQMIKTSERGLLAEITSEIPGITEDSCYCCCWLVSRNIGVGCHFLLQSIFPTQGSNPRLLHWQAGSLPLSHRGSPHFYCFFPIPLNHSFKDSDFVLLTTAAQARGRTMKFLRVMTAYFYI